MVGAARCEDERAVIVTGSVDYSADRHSWLALLSVDVSCYTTAVTTAQDSLPGSAASCSDTALPWHNLISFHSMLDREWLVVLFLICVMPR